MDEFDLMLVNAIQLNPRASWAELAGPLGVDSATLSRRWATLAGDGIAWVTCYVGPRQVPFGALALVDVSCAPGTVAEVAADLAAHPHALSVDLCAASTDLAVTAATAGLPAMTRYVTEKIGAIPGVRETHTKLVLRSYREGSSWRLGSLDPAQRSALTLDKDGVDRSQEIPKASRDIVLELGANGRMPVSELSARTGVSQSTVRRRLQELLDSGMAVLRCDFAHTMAGWHLPALIWLAAPPTEAGSVIQTLSRLPETRACWITSGTANICWNTLLHGPEDLERLVEQTLSAFPRARLVETSPIMRIVKRMGHLLDESGRSIGHVPMNVWSDPS